MQKTVQLTNWSRSPTLNTVLMVEHELRRMNESVISVAELKRRLPKQVNHYSIKKILAYLEESNKIVWTEKGVSWIQNPNTNLRKAIAKGLEL